MRVREHLSQREIADTLPLFARSAVVTNVSALDRDRSAEAIRTLRATLDRAGSDRWRCERPADDRDCEAWLCERLDATGRPGTSLSRFLPARDRRGTTEDAVTALEARYLQPYPSLFRMTVETGAPVEFVAGQYLALRYHGITRVYSAASSPNRDDVEFCIQRVPGGRWTSELALGLTAGDRVQLRGPFGDLTLGDPSSHDLVFLATGTGVAPFKSMIDYLFEEGLDSYRGRRRNVWLFLGAAWEDQLPYRDEFRRLAAARPNFHFVPTLSRERYLTRWRGETAYVQHALAKYLDGDALDGRTLPPAFARHRRRAPRYPIEARLDPAAMEVYACGTNAMVRDLVDAVERLGVPAERTQFEGFG